MNIVIVGGSFAGIHAAIYLRQLIPTSEIYLIEKQSKLGWIPSGFNLIVKGKVTSEKQLFWITKEELIDRYRIHVYTEKTVIGLEEKKVVLAGGDKLDFDRLILATGSNQNFRNVPAEARFIHPVKKIQNIAALQQKIMDAKKIAIIGAGQAGIEIAEGLASGKTQIHLYESRKSILFRYLDPEMTEPLVKEMKNQGISLFLEEQVVSLSENETAIVETERRRENYDLVLLANHSHPNNQMWEEQLTLNDDGTIWVDDYLQTSQKDVYAIGDAIQVTFRPTNEKMYVSLVNNAVRTARNVSKTISGSATKDQGTYRPVGNQWFGYFLGSVGMTEEESIFYPQKIETGYAEYKLAAINQSKVKVKFLFDSEKKILGAQLQSRKEMFHLLDQLTIAVEEGWTLEQLEEHELFFQPEYRVPNMVWSKVANTAYED
ncbi:NAD(P)/FAD-dependent oxidoreductase [Enterococcus faecium]|uniref:NAD(P)/FAD-dependent oxidoreductase n=1 Tax=Enterococcus faecium TaxID=1352 RepID=UPI0011581ADF|nr:FAD/NAD(P)-binding oxidoreductase [Enterococcus faecium]